MDFKADAYKKWIFEYVKNNLKMERTFKKQFPNVLTENLDLIRGGLCRLANVGGGITMNPMLNIGKVPAGQWEKLLLIRNNR